MAKLQFGGGVTEIRGSQAGNTWSRNRGGAYMRARVTPLNPQSSAQQDVRSSLSQLTTMWGVDLTQSQRDAWSSFAQAWPTTDVFGAVTVLSGLQMFVRQNMTLATAQQSLLLDPPINLDVEALTVLAASAEVSSGSISLIFEPSPLGA